MDVAIAGLGRMGMPIAERILAAGHSLTAYNRTPGKVESLVGQGAEDAGAPGELLREAEVCVTVLADDAALEEVVSAPDGILAGARPDTVLVDMSTVSVAASGRVAAAAGQAGVHFVRAPVSGNPSVVRAGNLAVIVSGPSEPFERVAPLLREIGPNVYYVGDADQARVVKLALQVLIAGTTELMSEALVLGEAGGVSREKLLEVMGNSAVGSPFVRYKTEALIRDDYTATFTTSMMKKDLDLVLGLADELGIPLPVAGELGRLVQEAIEAGHGDLDLTSLFLALRNRAGQPA
jgi:3-hydroxyisobutyrate dehydrogenase-like beta-hydroxyacid dehydrogenase